MAARAVHQKKRRNLKNAVERGAVPPTETQRKLSTNTVLKRKLSTREDARPTATKHEAWLQNGPERSARPLHREEAPKNQTLKACIDRLIRF